MSSKKDFELYQAIRHLSILKERPNADPKEVDEATKLVEHRQKTLGEPSERALLSRLHWWTVEDGLIGAFTEVITDENNSPIYLRTTGKTALAFRDKELEDHGVDYHKDGFGSPVGKWNQTPAAPELLTNDQLHALGIVEGRKGKIEFVSGVVVAGKVENILRRD